MMPTVVVFDLDDTLYKEIDYLHSAYQNIAMLVAREEGGNPAEIYGKMVKCYRQGLNVFQWLIDNEAPTFTIDRLLDEYRTHRPQICLDVDTVHTLSILEQRGIVMGLVTDGRSIQQRNKIDVLGLNRFVKDDHILISEEQGYSKPDQRLFTFFIDQHPHSMFCYVGDNPAKDFIAPNQLGWNTVCLLDDGRNIHAQTRHIPKDYQPKYKIQHITDLLEICRLP